MNVSLTPELEKFIEKKVKSGMYQTSSEVVRDALRYLQEREKYREQKLSELREMIRPAYEAAGRGETTPLDFKELRRKAAQELKQERKK